MKKTFSLISLGCFRNTYDSEVLTYRISQSGYDFLPFQTSSNKQRKKICDLLIINTCGFIDKSKEESLEVIGEAIELKKKNKVKKILVFGCLVNRYGNELKKFFPQIDAWNFTEKFTSNFKKRVFSSSYSGFLKICEGCSNKCSFCAIPLIKGNLHSRPLSEILKEVRYLEKKNIKELNIIGQDITSWGKDLGKKENLSFLLKIILKKSKKIDWIRLIYTHPKHFTDSLIELIAENERICKFIDLPIQHINDRILKAMNRRITKKDIVRLIEKIRKKIPNCAIRTSVIVGFPQETEKEFKELLRFIADVKFERLGAFIYSREENTKAYAFSGQVHPSTKKRRFSQIMNLQKNVSTNMGKSLIGKNLKVLIEKKENNLFVGRTQYDAPEVDGLVFVKKDDLNIGDFYDAKIVDSHEYDLIGQ